MSTVLVTGGSGTFGSELIPLLSGAGHEVRVLSRSPDRGTHVGDLATGEGIDRAAAGATVIVHAASDTRRVGLRDTRQTRNLLEAARDCDHLVYLSIVGVDRIPSANFGYYRRKLECEQLIESGRVPHTILRATQFHELIALVLTAVARWPVAPLPGSFRFQSVAAADVAAAVATLVVGAPRGRADDVGGPEVLSLAAMVDVWRERCGRPAHIVEVPFPGRMGRGFRAGYNTCPDRAVGRQRWAEFVAEGTGSNRL